MTPEEKKKLYKAIDYQENSAPALFPEEYVETSATFLLKILEIELRDDEWEKAVTVLVTNLKEVRCKFETRPATSGLKW
nr:vacuolar protein sorting-associated protein 13-like [Leptinotarsa decemlineata]